MGSPHIAAAQPHAPTVSLHKHIQQLAGLVVWAGCSLSSQLLNRMLLHYSVFGRMPCFLALGHAGMALLGGRLLLLASLGLGVVPAAQQQAAQQQQQQQPPPPPAAAQQQQRQQAAAESAQRIAFLAAYLQQSWPAWRHTLLLGACWGACAGLSNAALQQLPIPAVVLVQAMTGALSHSLAALLQQPQHATTASTAAMCCAVLALAGAATALWPACAKLSTAGVLLQAAASMLEVCWGRMHLAHLDSQWCAVSDGCRGAGGGEEQQAGAKGRQRLQDSQKQQQYLQYSSLLQLLPATGSAGEPLAVLANSAPAAALVLALPTTLLEGRGMDRDKFRYRGTIPAAAASCVLACCCTWASLQPGVLRVLATEPLGVAWRAMRDVCVLLAAAAAYNETVSTQQWVGYALAQLASVALCWGFSSERRRSNDCSTATCHVKQGSSCGLLKPISESLAVGKLE